jgi:hypothetical protein
VRGEARGRGVKAILALGEKRGAALQTTQASGTSSGSSSSTGDVAQCATDSSGRLLRKGQQPDTSVEDLEIAPHVPTRSPAECAQHMEGCRNDLAFFKRNAEGSTEKKVRVLTSTLASSEPLSCHVHTGPLGPAVRRQYDLCTRRNSKSTPCTSRRPPPTRQSAITSGSSSDFVLHILITRVLSSQVKGSKAPEYFSHLEQLK